MTNDEIWAGLTESLFSDEDSDDNVFRRKPLLAHYTTLDVLERILSSGEVWFSNPLFMNDLDEVRFGILQGAEVLREDRNVREALESEARHKRFLETFDEYLSEFERDHLLDTYIFCLSEHHADDQDGILSMWRGYGGNGRGAALVFDTSKLVEVASSPVFIAKVRYGTVERRKSWLQESVLLLAQILREKNLSDDQIYLASNAIFQRFKILALLMKHVGFQEENEWRAIYLPERDSEHKLSTMRGYHNGPRGVEPKLKFKFEALEGVTDPDFSLTNALDRILLGPTTSSILAQRSIIRMLELIGRRELSGRLVASGIPFRSF